jgi:hypothetical protein
MPHEFGAYQLWLLKVYTISVIASQSRQRIPLPYEDNEPSRSLGRLFLLSIPDLIRDPEGRSYSSFRGSETAPKQSGIIVQQPGLINKVTLEKN